MSPRMEDTPEDLLKQEGKQSLTREVLDLRAQVEALQAKRYIPGNWRCPKCNFRLLQSNLNSADGTVTARDKPGDRCPNCDGPLWRVSYQDEVTEAYAIATSQMERALAADTARASAETALAEERARHRRAIEAMEFEARDQEKVHADALAAMEGAKASAVLATALTERERCAKLVDAVAAKWRKRATKHKRPGGYRSDYEQNDLKRAVLFDQMAADIRARAALEPRT